LPYTTLFRSGLALGHPASTGIVLDQLELIFREGGGAAVEGRLASRSGGAGCADSDDRPGSSLPVWRRTPDCLRISGIGVTTARQRSERHPERDQDTERTLQHVGGPFGQPRHAVLHTRYDSLAATRRKGMPPALHGGHPRRALRSPSSSL